MTLRGSIGLFILVVMLIFMLLQLFGALTVPFTVWVVWLLVGVVFVAIGR